MGDVTRAGEHYAAAHKLLPEHLPSILGARRTLLAREQFAESLPLFDAELRATANPERKALVLLEKGRILEQKLKQPREAREAYETALGLDPTSSVAVHAVERVELGAKAWDALDKTYEREAQTLPVDARHRAAVLSERARLLEVHKRDALGATELYQAALDADSSATVALGALKRLHAAQQRHRDLIAVLEREASLATDPAVRALCLYRVGRLYADRLGDLEQAQSALERALTHVSHDPMILEELARTYELSKRYPELAGVVERIAAQTEHTGERIGLFHRLGQLHEERLSAEDRAVEWYERALALDRGYLPAIVSLAKLYTRRKQWSALVAVHNGEAETTQDPARRAAAHARIAQIFEGELSSPEQAVAHHARALGILPGYAPSFKALSRLYAQASRFAELAELYERAIDGAADDETKVTYLFKVGRLYEDTLSAPVQALTTYRRILELDGKHLGAIHALQRAAERAERYKDLVAALELEAEVVQDRRQKLQILHRAGEVSEIELSDDEHALELYKKVHELDKTYAPALASLGKLYHKAGRNEDLLETYQVELRLLPRGAPAAALLYKMGELYEESLANDEEAIACYRRALESDAFNRQALHALARKLSERGRFDELVKLLELELSGVKDPTLRARTAFRLGEVYEYRLKVPEKALLAYEQALLADQDFRPARDGRVRLLGEARDHKRLVEELAREAESTRDPKLAVSALLRQGEVYRDELGDIDRAVDCFEAVLARDPAHLDALLALEPLYADRAAWEPLSQVLAAQARTFGDPGARVAALRELGRIQEEHSGATAEQIRTTYFGVLQLAPTDLAALRALEHRALLEGDGKLLAHIDAKLGAVVQEEQLVAVHHVRLAEALEELGDPTALEVYRAALARDPESISAARGLSRLAERGQDPELLEESAEHEARMALDAASASKLFMKAANLRTDRGDVVGAVRALSRALELHPEYEPAAGRVRELLLARGEVDRLIAVLSQAAAAAKSSERVASLWVVVAELYADKKNDVPAGLAALHRAQNLAPNHVPTLMKLADLYARDAQWAEAVDRLNQAIAKPGGDDLKVDAHLRLATILDEHLGDPERAQAHLDSVLAAEPSNRGALERLLSLQKRQKKFDAAADTAQKLVRVSPELNVRVQALVEVGRLERARGQAAAALQAYEQAVALVGVNGAAASELRELLQAEGRRPAGTQLARYAAALTRFVDEARAGGPSLVPTYLELARVLGDEMGQPDQALALLNKGLQKHGAELDLQAELARRLLAASQFAPALAAARRVLEADVMRPEPWRQIADAFKGLQRPAEGVLALAPLLAINAANDLERATLAARHSRAGGAAARSFDASEFQQIDLLSADDPARRLLSQLAESLGKIHPPELERFGLNPRDRIGSKSAHPLRQLADRIASVFGVEDYDLYQQRAHSGTLEVEFSDPVSVIVPDHFAKLSEGQQLFALGRVFANVARGLHAVDKLQPEALELLLAAAARTADGNFGAGLSDEEFLSNHARRVSRALPWLGRGAVEEAARAYAASPRIDIGEWLFRVRATAARAALVLCDDLPGSITLVRQIEGDLAGLSGAALAPGMRLVHDLLRFWVSDPAIALRRRLGLL
jgi:tetratricopeptide (TPR) repeat protein